jgi:RNA polymerase sigma-70 factor (ECF subfamily)
MTTNSTSTSLLQRLGQSQDREAWKQFVDLYTPLMQHWAKRRLQLPDTDANDLVQETFAVLVEKLPTYRYDRTKSFRGWLWTVMRNKWRTHLRQHQHDAQADPAALQQLADDAEAFWEVDYRQHLVRRALELMQADFQPATWKACWEMVVNDRPAATVAQELGLTLGAAHAARYRVLARLRQELQGLLD